MIFLYFTIYVVFVLYIFFYEYAKEKSDCVRIKVSKASWDQVSFFAVKAFFSVITVPPRLLKLL